MAGWRLYWSVVIATCLLKEDCQFCSICPCTRRHGGHHLHFTPPADRSTVMESNQSRLSFNTKQVSVACDYKRRCFPVLLCDRCSLYVARFVTVLALWYYRVQLTIGRLKWIYIKWIDLTFGFVWSNVVFCGTQIESSDVRLYKSNNFSFKEEVYLIPVTNSLRQCPYIRAFCIRIFSYWLQEWSMSLLSLIKPIFIVLFKFVHYELIMLCVVVRDKLVCSQLFNKSHVCMECKIRQLIYFHCFSTRTGITQSV